MKEDQLNTETKLNARRGFKKKTGASVQRRELRQANRPPLLYNDDLPIMARKDDIIAAIQSNPVVIVSGETGSGKTTQIPKFCLAAGRGIDGLIGCTQPRRIAATSVARRIAAELGEELGKSVGYKIRFQDKVGRNCYIKIMTDGILLAETLSDRWLNRYDTIIVDEAHERSLNIDLLLGILKTLIVRRTDLKVVITSATIDTEKFSKAFEDAPVIEVSGRMYPVEVRYDPLEPGAERAGEQTHVEKAVDSLGTLLSQTRQGDILLFMPTEQDIRETCELIRAKSFAHAAVLPLYGRLSAKEQGQVFGHTAGRKIIVATNIAETSITIPGIKYVLDSGLARIPRYAPRTRTTVLPVLPVSRSSADQRKGRCGRVEDGICVRLYSEADYQARPLYSTPEILRANLAEVILRMLALRLDDISAFPFIDPPAAQSITDGFNLLIELGAVGRRSKERRSFFLTDIGKLMARLPLDPRLSRMLIEAHKEGCSDEIAVIASALSIQDPRERPLEKADAADRAHAVFKDPASDFFTTLNIWKRYHETLEKEKTAASLKRFCRANFLSYKRMREWRDIHGQVTAILQEFDLAGAVRQTAPKTRFRAPVRKDGDPDKSAYDAHYSSVHRAVLSGFLSSIALKKEKNLFRAARGREAMLFPGSALFNRAGQWIVAAEMVQTSRLFARTAANIDCSWLEALGRDQCSYTYLHPRWDAGREEVIATEQVSLYGLIIVSGRTVTCGRIDPQAAADVFIRAALVGGQIKRPPVFMRHNQRIVADIAEMENRLRRRDLFAGEEAMVEFYRKRLPGIYDLRTLAMRIREKGGDAFLRMQPDDLLTGRPAGAMLSLFPDDVSLGTQKFACSYRFEPGASSDGVTVQVPASLAAAVPPESTDWIVPGLLAEKITALIKGLAKEYRKKLVPVADTVAVIVAEMPKGRSALPAALSRFILERFGVDIPAAAWRTREVADHLRMRIVLSGPRGEALLSSRDPAVLRQDPAAAVEDDFFEKAAAEYERTGICDWDFGDLPETLEFKNGKQPVWVFYPGLKRLENAAGGVCLQLFRSRDAALASHLQGVAALYDIRLSRELKFLKKALKIPAEFKSAAECFGGTKKVEERLYRSVQADLFCRNIRTHKDFEAHGRAAVSEILAKGREKADAVLKVMEAVSSALAIVSGLRRSHAASAAALAFLEGVDAEIGRLVPETFMELYDLERLSHVIRYIRALSLWAERGLADLAKAARREAEFKTYREKLDAALTTLTPLSSKEKQEAVEELFWLLEEYRVSLFAQELKTRVPVSAKRLDAKVREIERLV